MRSRGTSIKVAPGSSAKASRAFRRMYSVRGPQNSVQSFLKTLMSPEATRGRSVASVVSSGLKAREVAGTKKAGEVAWMDGRALNPHYPALCFLYPEAGAFCGRISKGRVVCNGCIYPSCRRIRREVQRQIRSKGCHDD